MLVLHVLSYLPDNRHDSFLDGLGEKRPDRDLKGTERLQYVGDHAIPSLPSPEGEGRS